MGSYFVKAVVEIEVEAADDFEARREAYVALEKSVPSSADVLYTTEVTQATPDGK